MTPGVLQIDYKDAIDRGLRHNLGLLLAGDQTETARGERWKELSEMLPNLSARAQENVQTQSLAALGFIVYFTWQARETHLVLCKTRKQINDRLPKS